MKKFLLPFLLAFSVLQLRAQTTTEISNILNTKVAQITTANITALNNDAFSLDLTTIGYRAATLDLTGTWVATLTFQGSNDNFTTVTSLNVFSQAANGLVSTITANGHYTLSFFGYKNVRVRATAFTSGTAVSIIYGYFNNLDNPFLAVLPNGASTEATLSTLNGKIPSNLTVASTRLLIDGSGVTQPVSIASAITANIGTTNGLALDATLTGGTQQTKITDGTNVATVKAASTAAVATDKAVVVAISPNNTVSVSGTLTSNIGTTNGLALDATLTGGTQQTKITDGTNVATVKAASTAAVAADKAVVVAISPNNSVAVTGSVTANIGTTNGLALDATLSKLTIAQGAALGSNTQSMVGGSVTTAAPTYTTGQISPLSLTTGGLLRTDGSGVNQPVTQSGTWNINNISGTISLPTGAALETGGNLATTKTNTDNLSLAQASTTSGQKGNLALTATTTANPSYTTGQSNPLSTNVSGELRVINNNTQTVSGTVTSNIGTTNGLALDATMTGGTVRTKVTDGTNNAGVKAASTAAIATDPALVVAISPNNTVASTQSGTWTVQPGNTANTTAWKVDGSAVTQPVKFSQTTTDNDVDVATIAAGTNDIGYVNPDRTTSTTTITSAGNGNSFACKGMTGVGLNITGTAATFVFKAQISMDGGTTWSDTWLDAVSGNKTATRNVNGQFSIILAAGTTHVRVVLNSIVSGNFTYQYSATAGHDPSFLISGVAGSGQALPPLTGQVGGSDGTDLYPLSINAKGTQGAKALATQDLKDAGRTVLMFYANGVASGTTTTETAITLTKSSGTSATSTGTSFVITSGKTFRITSITVGSRGNATGTAQITTFNLRINTGGAVTTSSTPLVFAMTTATPATASAWDRFQLPIPDGYEIVGNGTIQFGITANSVFVTNAPTWFVNITGYEY